MARTNTDALRIATSALKAITEAQDKEGMLDIAQRTLAQLETDAGPFQSAPSKARRTTLSDAQLMVRASVHFTPRTTYPPFPHGFQVGDMVEYARYYDVSERVGEKRYWHAIVVGVSLNAVVCYTAEDELTEFVVAPHNDAGVRRIDPK